jgi:hypothetical protein
MSNVGRVDFEPEEDFESEEDSEGLSLGTNNRGD